MKKKWIAMVMVAVLVAAALAGCGKKDTTDPAKDTVSTEAAEPDAAEESDVQTPEADGDDDTEEVVVGAADLTCSLPGGFEPDPDETGLYVHKNYPVDSSTISYLISEGEEDITDVSKEDFKADLEADFLNAYGDQVNVDITEYEKIKVSGRKGLKILMSYEFKGVTYEQLMYMIYNGDESHILNFTQEQGGKWMEEFKKCGDSIQFTN